VTTELDMLTRIDFAEARKSRRTRIERTNVRRLRAAGVRILAGTDAANLTSHGVLESAG
jgi:imidazolonepropionase-like amidohydrolase